ncbi:MAG: S41 family peptidase [Planctomycetaceae bacterium]|nr:S41 family peptidase [Planctomycetaceae bacterium]MCA9044964.1 S41 family peptidase [Planctomycetaceae bacterium]MCB9949492.1 S41 family peptidase [Planctomycetaceae bacterium]
MLAPALLGQDKIPTASIAVKIGTELESRQSWREAYRHYKDAVKQFPEDAILQQGLRRAHHQNAIASRYSDQTFRTQLKSLSRDQSLALYDDVLFNSQSYYVESISTSSLVAHGTESLWLALENDKFIDENLFGAAKPKLQALQRKLYDRYWNYQITYQGQHRQVISEICDLCFAEVGLDCGPVIMEYVFGMSNCLDDYSSVLTPSKRQDLYGNIKGEFVGIGIVMEAQDNRGMKLIQVLPESPAFEQGLRSGDFIVGVDGTSVREMNTDEAANLLGGKSGSVVALEVARGETDLFKVECRRREVKMKSIAVAKIVDERNGVGYIQMTGFQQDTVAELDAALRLLQQQGMRSLIWDVRGNPGGLLTAAVEVLDRFISDGVIVETRGRVADQNVIYRAHRPGTIDVPVVLLVDENSASASEIVAGAIRDHHRGRIVGRTSYGKWSVQSIYDMRLGTAVRMTTAKFYSPNGTTWGKIGLQPDVVVQDGPKELLLGEVDLEHDPDMREALRQIQSPEFTQR